MIKWHLGRGFKWTLCLEEPFATGSSCCLGDASAPGAMPAAAPLVDLGMERAGSLLRGWVPAPGMDPCPVNGL